MKSGKILIISLLAGILLTGVGCGWIDNVIPGNDPNPIPSTPPTIEPDKGTATEWTKNINIEPIEGLTKDGWQPVKNVTLPTIYFAYDRSTIGASERYKLQQVAEYLKNNMEFGLIIEGNCDENGSAEYNRALGERRAIAAKDYLVNSGISAKRIKTISYGEDRLLVKGDTEAAHAKNRRDNLILARMR